MKEVREFKLLAEAENPELLFLWEETENVLNNQFISTATKDGVARIEKIISIVPKATDTLEERKFKILAKYNEVKPYTIRKLKEVLSVLCGENGYRVELNLGEFTLKVKIELMSKKNEDAVREMLERMVPVNMIFTVSLLYNQHKTLKVYTHSELAKFRHKDIREEVLNIG